MSRDPGPHYIKARCLILGCGNLLFGDDGFGPAVAERLAREGVSDGVVVMDAGTGVRTVLINVVLSERRPPLVIVVDAVDRGRKPGDLFWIDLEEIPENKRDDFSMHHAPTSNLLRDLREAGGVEVEVLACQSGWIPREVRCGLSPEVSAAVPKACEWLRERARRVLEPASDGGGAARSRIVARGVVQGVGFRPFVYRLAAGEGLTGSVVNTTAGVRIEVQGPPGRVRAFAEMLRAEARPPIRIDDVSIEAIDPVAGEERFSIGPSEHAEGAASLVPTDLATCPDCLDETLRTPGRRLGYPFTNCTLCGPRYTIVRGVPYDRPATTMSGFRMCDECRREYEDPLDRRYHAQPIACPACGPSVRLLGPDGSTAAATGADPVAEAAAALRRGAIVAVKGIGGFLLACDAADAEAVARLRERKRRGNKPFALMAADLDVARSACRIDPEEEAILAGPAAPILLLRRRVDGDGHGIAPAVAPGQPHLGLMLPYSPLHHLLFARGAPRLLVMTSGNRRDEPICIGEEAFERLAGIADLFLDHDRPIWNRCDDSVGFVHGGALRLVRRARGYVPVPTALPFDAPPTLGVGALLKGSICLAEGRRAVLGQHIGDTDSVEALAFLEEVLRNLSGWLGIAPSVVGFDPHPGYPVSELARGMGIRAEPVQHHHAHVAAAMAEAGLAGPVIGVALDGTGYGEDGTIWGGEILRADYGGFERVACLRPLPLPGGDLAIREPVRAAIAYAEALEIDLPPGRVRGIDAAHPDLVAAVRMQARSPRTVRTSSAGRLFDAVGVLLGGPGDATFEGETAMWLEALADGCKGAAASLDMPRRIGADGLVLIDPEPLLREIGRAVSTSEGDTARWALGFHLALAEAFARAAAEAAHARGIADVVLSGGVFQNRLLLSAMEDRLRGAGLRPHVHSLVPCNDGGVALGQAVVAAFRVSGFQFRVCGLGDRSLVSTTGAVESDRSRP
ncbi:MAG: carbamoyltransferase HypF, partial [Myxococcota bacterium]|nr:carbamoyltransferase HypF [Myxococcota bacterium]